MRTRLSYRSRSTLLVTSVIASHWAHGGDTYSWLQEITIADLFHLTYGSMLAPLGINALEDASKRPNLARCVHVKAALQVAPCADILA